MLNRTRRSLITCLPVFEELPQVRAARTRSIVGSALEARTTMKAEENQEALTAEGNAREVLKSGAPAGPPRNSTLGVIQLPLNLSFLEFPVPDARFPRISTLGDHINYAGVNARNLDVG